MKNSQKVSKHQTGVFRARKTHQNFEYSVLGQMGLLFSNLRLLRKTQFTSDITQKILILHCWDKWERMLSNIRLLLVERTIVIPGIVIQ